MGLEFGNCCFCIELRTGSLIIGYLSLVGNILLTLSAIVRIPGGLYSMHEVNDEDTQTAVIVAVIALTIALILIVINLTVNIILLVGLHTYKRGHVRAYIYYTSIFIVLKVTMFILNVATGTTAVNIAIDLITILLSIYFMLVIRSYYLKMDDSTMSPGIYNRV